MSEREEKIQALDQALKSAFRAAPPLELDESWSQRTMLAVRRASSQAREQTRHLGEAFIFRRMLLPSAGLTGLVAAGLALITLGMGPGLEDALFNLLSQDPTAALSLGLWGM